MSDKTSNIHRAVNIKSLSDKDLKKYFCPKVNDNFQINDLLNLYDDEYVEICKDNRLLKYKILKENKVFRKK